jgi:hypothetical protein
MSRKKLPPNTSGEEEAGPMRRPDRALSSGEIEELDLLLSRQAWHPHRTTNDPTFQRIEYRILQILEESGCVRHAFFATRSTHELGRDEAGDVVQETIMTLFARSFSGQIEFWSQACVEGSLLDVARRIRRAAERETALERRAKGRDGDQPEETDGDTEWPHDREQKGEAELRTDLGLFRERLTDRERSILDLIVPRDFDADAAERDEPDPLAGGFDDQLTSIAQRLNASRPRRRYSQDEVWDFILNLRRQFGGPWLTPARRQRALQYAATLGDRARSILDVVLRENRRLHDKHLKSVLNREKPESEPEYRVKEIAATIRGFVESLNIKDPFRRVRPRQSKSPPSQRTSKLLDGARILMHTFCEGSDPGELMRDRPAGPGWADPELKLVAQVVITAYQSVARKVKMIGLAMGFCEDIQSGRIPRANVENACAWSPILGRPGRSDQVTRLLDLIQKSKGRPFEHLAGEAGNGASCTWRELLHLLDEMKSAHREVDRTERFYSDRLRKDRRLRQWMRQLAESGSDWRKVSGIDDVRERARALLVCATQGVAYEGLSSRLNVNEKQLHELLKEMRRVYGLAHPFQSRRR